MLIVVDLQSGIYKFPGLYKKEELIQNTKELITEFRNKNVPVIFLKQNGVKGHCLEKGTEGWEIIEDIKPEKNDLVIEKSQSSGFHDTNLAEVLENIKPEKVFLVGIQTEACFDSTFRHGVALGINIFPVKDMHSTWPSMGLTAKEIINHHNNIFENYFERLINKSELVNLLKNDF